MIRCGMIKRIIQKSILASLKRGKSILLIGPRQTGKSTLIQGLSPDYEFNLANQETFLDFVRDPGHLEASLKVSLPKGGIIFIDEVQRVSSILNTVQYLIDKKCGYQFILTGSSARKLRRGRANLLPGRVHTYFLGPIIAKELLYKVDSNFLLSFGSMPWIVTEKNVREIKKSLKSYSLTYLNEEIKAEALTKNIEGFTRFLFCLAADAGKYLDLTKISKTVAVPRQTVQRYFEILEDTLIVKRVAAFAKSEKRRLIQHPRFYFFDNGVLNALLGNFTVSDDRKGFLFENFFFNQLETSLSYSDYDYRISTYRTDAGAEVDLILELNGKVMAIELKSGFFSKRDLGGLASFEKLFGKKVQKFVVTLSGHHKKLDGIEIIPWEKFLEFIKI